MLKKTREKICWHYLSYGGACLGHHVPSTFLTDPHSIIQLVTVSVLRAPGTKSFQSQIQKAEGVLLIEYFFLFVLITKHLRHKRKPQALRGEHEQIGCGDSNGVLTWPQGKTSLASQKLPCPEKYLIKGPPQGPGYLLSFWPRLYRHEDNHQLLCKNNREGKWTLAVTDE